MSSAVDSLFNYLRHSTLGWLLVPLLCGMFTYLWNPIGFPFLAYDEGTYIGRAMNILTGLGFEDYSIFYDHPYFGQIFLASIFWIIGFPGSLHPSSYGNVLLSVEMLWLVPRILMGVLAVIDTFLVYKISEHHYNSRKIAFISSLSFAVMPPNWLLRQPYLDSILLPFVLSSILFATFYNKSFYSPGENNKIKTKNLNKRSISILLSGIFLGLAIFTKIPAFAMIPLVAFLIYKNNKSVKILGLWIIPVILIPLIWPAYALFVGEFNLWLEGIYYQTHRASIPLINALGKFFNLGSVLVGLGITGLVFAGLKRDLFLLLWTVPFLILLYLIDLVRDFHLILIFPALCIAAAKLIEHLSNKLRNKKIQQILSLSIISSIGIFGLISTILLVTTNVTSHYFEAAAYIVHYLQNDISSTGNKKNDKIQYHFNDTEISKSIGSAESKKDERLTLVSSHVYSWIPRYVFKIPVDYKEPYDAIPIKDQYFLVVDKSFKNAMSVDDEIGAELQRIYNLSKTIPTSYTIQAGPYKNSFDLLITKPMSNAGSRDYALNLIDKTHIWKPRNYAKISQNGGELIINVNTKNTNKIYNGAFLQTELAPPERPLLLTLEYASKPHVGNASFQAEIKDNNAGHKTLWKSPLNNTSGNFTKKSFILHEDIFGRPLEFILYLTTDGPGKHTLSIKNIKITYT